MAYEPTNWAPGVYVNPTNMNHIEQGIANATQTAESAGSNISTIEAAIGTQSIAGIGDGTLKGATWKINNDLTTLNSKTTQMESTIEAKADAIKLVASYFSFDSDGHLPIPEDIMPPRNNGQLVITTRNTANGNIARHWYDASSRKFRYLDGTASKNGQAYIQYLA